MDADHIVQMQSILLIVVCSANKFTSSTQDFPNGILQIKYILHGHNISLTAWQLTQKKINIKYHK